MGVASCPAAPGSSLGVAKKIRLEFTAQRYRDWTVWSECEVYNNSLLNKCLLELGY